MTRMYVIQNMLEAALFWNSHTGRGGALTAATGFSESEKSTLPLPFCGHWVSDLPNVVPMHSRQHAQSVLADIRENLGLVRHLISDEEAEKAADSILVHVSALLLRLQALGRAHEWNRHSGAGRLSAFEEVS